MILRKLIEKLIQLLTEYQKENAGPDLGFAINVLVTPVVNAAKSITTDRGIKGEKISASELLKLYLEDILKAPKIEIGVLSKIKERFEAEKAKAKDIRKDNAPGTYDGVLETCAYAVDRALYYYHLCGLKTSKDEDINTDPRLILENFMLDYLIDSEILKKKKYAPKATVTRIAEIFSGWGGKDESLAEELMKQVQEFLCRLDISCKAIDKASLQYIIIVDSSINSALYEEAEKCKAKGVESNPLKNILHQARIEIQKLESYKIAKATFMSEMSRKAEDSNQDVRVLLSQRFSEKKKEDEQMLLDELEQKRRRAEAEQKRKEEEAKKKAEDEARKKSPEERKKLEEEAEKKRIEEARKKAEEDKKKLEEERRKKEEAEKGKKQDERGAEGNNSGNNSPSLTPESLNSYRNRFAKNR